MEKAAKKQAHPTNEHDVKRTEIRCRDDIALARIELRSKSIGIIYALIWGGALVAMVQIIATHLK
jgi:hypothetical protein